MPKPRVKFRRMKGSTKLHGREAFDALHAVRPELAKPLGRAIAALEANDLIVALQQFGKCAEIDPTNKVVLYFGSDACQRAYFGLKYSDPQPPDDRMADWRRAAFTLTQAAHEADPTDPVACHNVGRFVQDDGDDAGAIAWYRKALLLKRDQVESWGNLGTALYNIGKPSEAEVCWSKCVAFDAINASGHLAQAYIWLRRGDYARGWPALNMRWQDQTFTASYGRKDLLGKPWTGQPLKKGESVLLHGEQGLGDHVQFARYIPALLESGVKVAGLETRGPLKRWMEQALPTPVFVRDSDKLPNYTHHAPLMSLPGILKLADIPAPVRPTQDYVNVRRATCDRSRRVGIVWAGTTGNPADFQRSMPAEHLHVLADIPGVTWVPLQFDPSGTADLTARAWLGPSVESVTYADVLGLADIMAGLDTVVTVDTLALHVAGSLGVPTYALHRFNREWRFGQHTESCAWYPSVTNLTQSQPNDWAELLTRLRARLQG